MDREVVEQKLESLRRCLQRIETKCPPEADTLITDFDLQDIVSLNLSRAVQLCVDIGAHLISGMDVPPPDTMGQTFDRLAQAGVLTVSLALSLKKAVGFRNSALKKCKERAQNNLGNWLPLLLDDCTDAGGRATQGAVAEENQMLKLFHPRS